MIRSYGVSTQGDSSEVLEIRLMPSRSGIAVHIAADCRLFGISPDEVDHWIRYAKRSLQFEQQYKDLQRTFGVNGGEMARARPPSARDGRVERRH